MNNESKIQFKDVIKSALPHLRALAYALIILLSLLGFFFSEGEKLMYNSLIMPVVGVIGYIVFGWKAIYKLPAIIQFTDLFAYVTGLVALDLYSTVIWSLIYCLLAIVGFAAAFLLGHGIKKRDGKKTVVRVVSIILSVLLCGVIGIFANGLIGNPISKALAMSTAKNHLKENYANTDFVIESISYDFKFGNYHAFISSPSSVDSDFSLEIGMNGKLINDSYEDRVLSKRNTADRIGWDYRKLADSIFESKIFSYDTHIAFGELIFAEADYIDEAPDYAIATERLTLDKFYDVNELGADSGELTVYIYDDTVSAERLSEILLGIKKAFDDAGVRFYAIDCVLEYPRSDDGTANNGRIEVMDFLYTDIYDDGLVERVKASDAAAKEYYATEDAKKI